MVRGNKWGLRLDAVDKKEKDKGRREVDPILDELEKTLRIAEEQSYRHKEKDQNPRDKMARFETEEGATIPEYDSTTSEEDDDNLDDILG